MIKIKNASIIDILPHTFLTDEGRALAAAIGRLTGELCKKITAIVFWGDIENASPVVLDALAQELDCPFYSDNLSDDQKRSIIAATFRYNSHISTVGAVQEILNAAFGGGKITEWFDYDGEPYHFKLNLPIAFGKKYISREVIENFYKILEKAKNKRSKLDDFTIYAIVDFAFNIVSVIADKKNRSIVPPAAIPIAVTAVCEAKVITATVIRHNKTVIYPARYEETGYSI